MKNFIEKYIYSFEYMKRYKNEIWYYSWELKLNHGKVKPNQALMTRDDIYCFVKWSLINLGIKYQKISLKCNHSHKATPKYNERLLKQAQRRSQSIREDCKARITISWPLKSLSNKSNLSYISMIRDIHSYELTLNFDTK